DPAGVVRMHACRGRRIPLGQQCMRAFGAQLVVDRLPALALPRCRRRWQLEIRQRRPEVEPRTADEDRSSPGGDDLVDRRVREPLVAADGDVLIERYDADQTRRMRGRRGRYGEYV